MSTIISQEKVDSQEILEYPQILIIKGFSCEQCRLKCVWTENWSVILVGKGGKAQARLKTEYAYCDDEKKYAKLKKAFDSGDSELLAVL